MTNTPHSGSNTAIVRAVVEEISHQKKDPGQFLRHMNQVLLPVLRQENEFLYAAACYMVVDVSTGLVRMANAGHPTPMLLDAANECSQWFVADRSYAGPALAICEDPGFTTVERTIHPGDAVVLFTDGIYEVAGAGQEEFGEERLLAAAKQHKALSLPALFPALLNDARQFAKDGEFDDDVCLVGFQVTKLLTD